jgi:asparagine synthase (glutamine-hydrolysing)
MISRLPRQVDRRLHTVSFVFNHASSSDEREFIEAAEGQLGARGLHLNEDDCPVLAPLPASLRPDCPTNVLLFFSRYDRVAREMHRQGARVLLNGIGGDQLFWSEPPAILPLADLLMRGHIASFFAESWTSSRTERLPYVKTLWWCLRSILFEGRVIEEDNDVDVTGTWLQPGFVSRNRLGERSHAMKDDLGFFLPSTTTQYSLWRQTMRTFALEPCPDNYYVDIRYPYLDRRLLEFALAIPLEQKVRPNQTRSVVRRSLSGIVPDAIRLRTSKGGPDEAFHRAAVREGDRLTREFTDLRLVTLGIVDPVRFAGALRRLRHGISENFMQLMRTLSLEFWLRSLEYPEHGSPSQAPASAAVTIPPKRAWSAAAAFSD